MSDVKPASKVVVPAYSQWEGSKMGLAPQKFKGWCMSAGLEAVGGGGATEWIGVAVLGR